MDKLFIIFIGIVFSLFLLSSILLYTQWFDSYFSPYTQELEFKYMIGHIKFYTSLVLIFFLIAQANYMIKLNRNVKKKELQRNLGIVFGFLLIIKILVFYYSSIPIIEFNNRVSSYHLGTNAQKNKMDAYMTYMDYGVLTDYYDINDTKQCYQPSLEDIHSRKDEVSLKKEQKIFMKLFHEAPLNIVIVFLTLISAFYFSSQLARKKNVT